jgi:hypothetical protein
MLQPKPPTPVPVEGPESPSPSHPLPRLAIAATSDHVLEVTARLAARFGVPVWVLALREVVGEVGRTWTSQGLVERIAAWDRARLLSPVRWSAGAGREDLPDRDIDDGFAELCKDLEHDVDAGFEFFHFDAAHGLRDEPTVYDRVTALEWLLELLRERAIPRARRIEIGFDAGAIPSHAEAMIARHVATATARGHGLARLVTGCRGRLDGVPVPGGIPSASDWLGPRRAAASLAPVVLRSIPAAVEANRLLSLCAEIGRPDLEAALRHEILGPQARGVAVPTHAGASTGATAGHARTGYFGAGRDGAVPALYAELADEALDHGIQPGIAIREALECALEPWFRAVVESAPKTTERDVVLPRPARTPVPAPARRAPAPSRTATPDGTDARPAPAANVRG